jgi:hypothetical protein
MDSFSAYSDESGIFDHPYQSVAVVSGAEEILSELRDELQEELGKKQIREVKFSRIVGYNSPTAQAARRFIISAVKSYAANRRIRIDVLTWDTADSRHAVPDRDDLGNLGRMYYHVLLHMARQWNQIHWNFYPDNNPKVDWNETARYLNATSLYRTNRQQPELVEAAGYDELQFGQIEQVDSVKEPLVQLADLFAGMARYSHEDGRQCVEWLESRVDRRQMKFKDMCPADNTSDVRTRRRRCVYQLIANLYTLCKRHKLHVSLHERGCLWTRVCSKPINFWLYEPQGSYDKAPVKQ